MNCLLTFGRASHLRGIQRGMRRRVWRSLAALLIAIPLGALSGESGSIPLRKLHLELVLSDRLTPGADHNEIAAAAETWVRLIGASEGLTVDSRTEVSGSIDFIKKRVDAKDLDIVILPALEYLSLDREGVMEPVVTLSATQNPKGKIRYVVLTNQDAGLSTLESLKNKTVLTYSHADERLSRMWTEVLLHEHHLASAESYFRSVASTVKPSTSCLPVFFGKADACIIDDASWNVLKELNPQLGLKLEPIAESPLLLETVIALHTNRREYRTEIVHGMLSMQDTSPGRQVLLFFKSRRTYGIVENDLAEVVELRSAYQKLSLGQAKPPRPGVATVPTSADTRRN